MRHCHNFLSIPLEYCSTFTTFVSTVPLPFISELPQNSTWNYFGIMLGIIPKFRLVSWNFIQDSWNFSKQTQSFPTIPLKLVTDFLWNDSWNFTVVSLIIGHWILLELPSEFPRNLLQNNILGIILIIIFILLKNFLRIQTVFTCKTQVQTKQ